MEDNGLYPAWGDYVGEPEEIIGILGRDLKLTGWVLLMIPIGAETGGLD
jgi:hypothetical protein